MLDKILYVVGKTCHWCYTKLFGNYFFFHNFILKMLIGAQNSLNVFK
jgi:hypothetical protein